MRLGRRERIRSQTLRYMNPERSFAESQFDLVYLQRKAVVLCGN